MIVLLVPIYAAIAILLYGSGADYVGWAMFVGIGGFVGLLSLAADGG
jgi:hypothetical protein